MTFGGYMKLTKNQKKVLKAICAVIGVGGLLILTNKHSYKFGKLYGACRMADLVNLNFNIPIEELPGVFEAAGIIL